MTVALDSDACMTRLLGRLLKSVDSLTDELTAEILNGEHSYAESTLLRHDQLRAAVHDNLCTLLTALRDGGTANLAAPRAAGRLKAEQGIPVAALLHAYRLAGRFVWDRLLALALDENSTTWLLHRASDIWVVIDECSSAAAEAYRTALDEQARRDTAARGLMLATLFDGTAGNSSRAWEIVRVLRLDRKGPFLVVCAEIDDGADPLPAVQGLLRASDIDSEWIHRAGSLLGLLAPVNAQLAQEVARRLDGIARSRIGISRSFASPMDAPNARREAQLAAQCLPPGIAGTHVYGTSPVALLAAAAPDVASEVARTVLGPLLLLPVAERDVLLDTLDVWFATGGSTAHAAEHLHCHRNTVLYRLHRIAELTERRTGSADSSAELYMALKAARLGALG